VTEITQPTIKGALSIKTYKSRPSHPYTLTRTKNISMPPLQPQNAPQNSYAAALTSHQHQYESATPNTLQKSSPPTSVIQEMQAMLKGLMDLWNNTHNGLNHYAAKNSDMEC